MKGQRIAEASKAIFILCICSDHWLWANYCAGADTKKKQPSTVPTPKVNRRNMNSNGKGDMSVLFLLQHYMH